MAASWIFISEFLNEASIHRNTLLKGERAYGPRNGKYGGSRTGEDPQKSRASGLGRAGRASGVIGRKGACATARAPEGGARAKQSVRLFSKDAYVELVGERENL
jgi:hypothetical protein